MDTILDIVLLYSKDHPVGSKMAHAVKTAFGASNYDSCNILGTTECEHDSIWSAVRLHEITEASEIYILSSNPLKRVLWVVIPHHSMHSDTLWGEALFYVNNFHESQSINATSASSLLLYGDVAISEKYFRGQARDIYKLGEDKVAPHRFALLALHRARVLLHQTPRDVKPEQLTLFISHAKSDGIFFAEALFHAIEQLEEFKAFYDAKDIQSGDNWRQSLMTNASNGVLIALRTESYTSRPSCIQEFCIALESGIPILVVDALVGTAIPPTPLPFSSMPTVRIQDGSTFRVLVAALREHVRFLLVETKVTTHCKNLASALPRQAWKIWPRLPDYETFSKLLNRENLTTPTLIVIAEAARRDFDAAAAIVNEYTAASGRPGFVCLSTAEFFGRDVAYFETVYRSHS